MRHIIVSGLALLAFVVGSLSAQVLSSTTIPSPIVALTAPSFMHGDFDGSGKEDLLVWFPNPTAYAPQTLVGAYFDPGTNPAAILGAATPSPVVTTSMFPSLWQLRFVEKANLNGDDVPDLLIEMRTNLGAYEVWGLINTGVGTFAPPVLVDVLNAGSTKVAVGDFDGDGVNEYMSRWFTSLRISDPNGSSTVVETASFINQVSQIVVGDWNGDGADDAVLAFDATVTPPGLWLRLFNGSFSGVYAPTTPSGVNVSTNGSTYAVGFAVDDINGDGADDLLVAPSFPGTAVPLLQFGGPGGFGTALPLGSVVGTQYTWVAPTLADMDADGVPNIVSTSNSGGTPLGAVTMLLGHVVLYPAISAPNGTSSVFNAPPPSFGPFVANQYFPRAIGDFDGDGDNDVIVALQAYLGSFFYYVENRTIYGAGCAGSLGVPRLDFGTPYLSNTAYTVTISSARPNSIGYLLPSLAEAPFPGCVLVDIAAPNFIAINGGLFSFPTSATGGYALTLDLSAFFALAGQTRFFQAAIVDPGGSFSVIGQSFAMTAGRSVTYF